MDELDRVHRQRRHHDLYEVYRDGVLDHRATGTSTVTYVDPGLDTFVLRAVDGSGNRSGPSNAFTVQLC